MALVSGCTPEGADEESGAGAGDSLTPTFAPAEDVGPDPELLPEAAAPDAGGEATVADAAETGAPDAGGEEVPTGTAPAAPGAAAPADATATTSSMTDPVGDPTPSAAAPRPAWADLAGGSLLIAGDTVELRIRLADQVPDAAPDEEHTMNIASFFDVDGDGVIDYEVWVNLNEGGWGPAYFDGVDGGARFGDASGVTVAVAGDELVLAFPSGHLGGAQRLRWSLASEWGRYEAIGTPVMARDDAPDDDQPVDHPS